MKRIALGLEYDGSQFHGWQIQKEQCSVQETLEKALSTVANEPIATICAGRTDTGVHAIQQVVHFDTQAERNERGWIFGANTVLPHALRVLWTREVPSHFNARRSAISRHYRYILYNHPVRPSLLRQYVAWYYKQLDVPKMLEASKYWLGEQDFTSFRAAECQSHSAIRNLTEIHIRECDSKIILDFKANAFLYHMVRNMVGVLLEIGSGEAKPCWAREVLVARNRCLAGITAPASGLYLVGVNYPEQFDLPTTNEAAVPFYF